MERKDFLKKFTVGGSILFSYPLLFLACSDDTDDIMDNGNGNEITIDLSNPNYAALGTTGGFVYEDNIIIIRTGETSYTALSSVCTHQACQVSYNKASNELPCPCHGSRFSINGAVLNGPAQTSLKKYPVRLEDNMLIINNG